METVSIVKMLISYCEPYNKHDNGNDISDNCQIKLKESYCETLLS